MDGVGQGVGYGELVGSMVFYVLENTVKQAELCWDRKGNSAWGLVQKRL
jgi:hypothetical protein